tara:strand:+ start:1201 stop:1614 length:414 start_codon:yes stop_codon:yes gene_type:complete
MELVIIRTSDNGAQTIGMAFLKDNLGQVLFSFRTLEKPFLNNAKRISCIPVGRYVISKRVSQKYGTHFLVENTPNRSLILIHVGNFVNDTLGCILVGSSHKYINSDTLLDVANSLPTMGEILRITPAKLHLVILNSF